MCVCVRTFANYESHYSVIYNIHSVLISGLLPLYFVFAFLICNSFFFFSLAKKCGNAAQKIGHENEAGIESERERGRERGGGLRSEKGRVVEDQQRNR